MKQLLCEGTCTGHTTHDFDRYERTPLGDTKLWYRCEGCHTPRIYGYEKGWVPEWARQ